MTIANSGSFFAGIQFDYMKGIEIQTEDILECYFIEDIYSMYTLGKITLFDKYGIKEYGPLTGNEQITLKYGKTGLVEKSFTIYRIPKVDGVVEFQKTSKSVIDIYFADSYFNNIIYKRFSKSWAKDTLWTNIIKDITGNMLEVDMGSMINIEPSKDRTEEAFVIPQWNAAETIRWISNRITGTKGKYGYLFYSNSKQFINFVTLDNLLKNAIRDPQVYMFDNPDIEYENKILSWESMGVDHTGIREIGGGQMLGFDPASKKFLGIEKDEDFVYSKVVDKITSLGSSSLFDKSIDNDIKKFNYMYKVTGESNQTVLKNMYYNNFIRRYSLHNMLKLLVTGHDKRYAGGKIDIMWPSHSEKEIFNSMDSGQYLIKSITHQFFPLNTPLYTQVLVLIKNAYNDSKTSNNVKVPGIGFFDFSWEDILGSIY